LRSIPTGYPQLWITLWITTLISCKDEFCLFLL
jgi:hypothetical protein